MDGSVNRNHPLDRYNASFHSQHNYHDREVHHHDDEFDDPLVLKLPSRTAPLPTTDVPPLVRPSPLGEDEPFNIPQRIQELKHDDSVLTLAVSDKYIFAGTHTGEIFVWSIGTFELVRRFQAHKRHVLWLYLSDPASDQSPSSTSNSNSNSTSSSTSPPSSIDSQPRRSILVSSAGDALVSVWCPNTFARLYEIYWLDHIGDVFSCAYSAQQDTVYIGAQNTSIQWVNLSDPDRRVPHDNPNHPDQRIDPFFDSKAVSGKTTPRKKDKREALIPPANETLEIYRSSIGRGSHTGFIYCMMIAKGPTVLVDPDEEVLVTGGGEGWIKLWRIKKDKKYDGMEEWEAWDHREIMCLGEQDAQSVFHIAIDGSFLYAGKKRGVIELWDLDTKQKLRVIKDHRGENDKFGDIMSLQMAWGHLWSAATTGTAAVGVVLQASSFTQILIISRYIAPYTLGHLPKR